MAKIEYDYISIIEALNRRIDDLEKKLDSVISHNFNKTTSDIDYISMMTGVEIPLKEVSHNE